MSDDPARRVVMHGERACASALVRRELPRVWREASRVAPRQFPCTYQLEQLIRKQAPAKADGLVEHMRQALEAGNPSAAYKPILNGLIERDRAQDDNLVYSSRGNHVGMPSSSPKRLGKRPRNPREGNLRTTQNVPCKARKVIGETEPSSGAEQMAKMLINIKANQVDWTKAESLANIDDGLHQLVTFLVTGTFDQAFLERSLEGHSKSRKFSEYLSQMAAIFELSDALENART